eukprot:1437839-Alexandrium_andersonii.AAC.1
MQVLHHDLSHHKLGEAGRATTSLGAVRRASNALFRSFGQLQSPSPDAPACPHRPVHAQGLLTAPVALPRQL